MLAPTGRRPDVLIGRGAEHGRGAQPMPASCPRWRVAARISSWRAGSSTMATAARQPRCAKAQAFRCDGQGCTARVKGMLLAVANSPAALRDDCAAAAILVLKFPKPKGCSAAGPGDRRRRLEPPRRPCAPHRWRTNPHRDGGRHPRRPPLGAAAPRGCGRPGVLDPVSEDWPARGRQRPRLPSALKGELAAGQNLRIRPTRRPWMSTWSGPKMRVS